MWLKISVILWQHYFLSLSFSLPHIETVWQNFSGFYCTTAKILLKRFILITTAILLEWFVLIASAENGTSPIWSQHKWVGATGWPSAPSSNAKMAKKGHRKERYNVSPLYFCKIKNFALCRNPPIYPLKYYFHIQRIIIKGVILTDDFPNKFLSFNFLLDVYSTKTPKH